MLSRWADQSSANFWKQLWSLSSRTLGDLGSGKDAMRR